MSEEDLKEEQKKQEEDQAGQKAAHTLGKGVATYFGGSAGNKAYELASKLGPVQEAEKLVGKSINTMPGMKHVTKAANESGALDLANAGIDAASGDVGSVDKKGADVAAQKGLTKETIVKEGLEEKDTTGSPVQTTNDQNSSENNEDAASDGGGKKKKNKTWLFFMLWPFLCIGCVPLTLILVSVLGLLATGQAAIDFFAGILDSVVGYSDMADYEEKYYKKLEEAQQNAYQKYKVCIDVNLIHATLTVNKYDDDKLQEGEELCEDETCSEGSELISKSEYKKMSKYIDLLASMQIKRKKYALYNTSVCPEYLSSSGDRCTEGKTDAKMTQVTAENIHCLDTSWFDDELSQSPFRDSSSPRLVARNDKESIFDFMTKRANREKNYEYILYQPSAIYVKEKDGTERRVCNETLPTSSNDFAELDIADWDKMEDSVYFYNLLDSFVEEYYSDYLSAESGYAEEGTERYDRAVELIDKIYDYYTLLGPNRNCSESYGYMLVSNLCPNGVTVVGKSAGTYPLEEYVAGVVEAELYADFPMAAKKALAVAARSYVIATTNSCEQAIDNSSNAQNFNPNYSQESWQAAQETAGEVLTDNGKVFAAQYDSWDCPGSSVCTYTKLPSGETHTVTISSRYFSRAAGGHGRGMSQIAAADMAADGQDYKSILSYFYTGTIGVSYGGSGSGVKNQSTSEKLAFLFPEGIPISAAEMQKYLTTVSVPLVSLNGTVRTGSLTVHKAIANDVVEIFNHIANAGFPIKDAYCYSWRGMAGNSQSTSHHSYGVACDINAKENYMIRNGQIIAGSYWKPGVDPFSITETGPVVSAFTNYGWTWGGNWTSSKDYMHFSFTGH